MKISGPGQSPLLLLSIIPSFNKVKIPYAVVGAFAASFYGVVRASLDADAVIFLQDDEKLNRFLSSLEKQALKVELRRGDSRDPIRCVINIEDKFQNRVDLLIGIRGMRDDAFERVIAVSFMKSPIKIIGVEDFIAMKLFAGSFQDSQDIAGVLQVSGSLIDLPLLKQLARHYGKKESITLEKILRRTL